MKTKLLMLAAVLLSLTGHAEMTSDNILDRYNFIYAGESKNNRVFTVKDGNVSSVLNLNNLRGEISDAILLGNGGFLLAHQYGVTEITPEGDILWQYDAPEGTEIHTVQPIGEDKVVIVQNGRPAKTVAMDMIIGEWPEFESLNYCDEYLREAAMIPNAPSGTVYMRDGKPIEMSLGIMEHWNNPQERKYTAIDLIYTDIK